VEAPGMQKAHMICENADKVRVPTDTMIITYWYWLSSVNYKSFVWCELWVASVRVSGVPRYLQETRPQSLGHPRLKKLPPAYLSDSMRGP
jgi:hypothetical protein